MRKMTLIFCILAFMSCKPEQEATQFEVTVGPSISNAQNFETLVNTPVEISYKSKLQEDMVLPEIVVSKDPQNGELTACQSSDLEWKCIYIPRENFVGVDSVGFKIKDGNFFSGEVELRVSVKKHEYMKVSKNIVIPSSSSISCDPLGQGEGAESSKKGISGNIRLIKDSDSNLQYNLANYLDEEKSYKVEDLYLFMNQVDVPKRSFDQGFALKNNELLEVNGQALIEFFNINLTSSILAVEDDQVGEYEFAIVSDDGARLSLGDSLSDKEIYLESLSTHAPKMICHTGASNHSRFISISRDKPVGMLLNYCQGPRYHIALQMIWRKKDEEHAPSSYCGKGISSIDFANLLNEGWSVVPSNVFHLPEGIVNACFEEEVDNKLQVLDFSVPKPHNNDLLGLIKNVNVSILSGANFESLSTLQEDDYYLSEGQVDGDQVNFKLNILKEFPLSNGVKVQIDFEQRSDIKN